MAINSPAPDWLTTEQAEALDRLAHNTLDMVRPPIPEINLLSAEWGVPFRDVAQAAYQVAAQIVSQRGILASIKPRGAGPEYDLQWIAESQVSFVQAAPGEIAVLPRNFVLAQARESSKLEPRAFAYQCGIRPGEYKRIEDGAPPTPDQATRISQFLGKPISELFPVAIQPASASGFLRGFSYLGLLRVGMRMGIKQLCGLTFKKTGVTLSANLVAQIEKGVLTRGRTTPAQQLQVLAIANYLDITEAEVYARVTPERFQQLQVNNVSLHNAFKAAYVALPPAEPLAIAGGGERGQ